MDDAADPTPRWRQRFENYRRALARLDAAVQRAEAEPLDDIIRAGLIQHFEFTCELAWRTLADLLRAQRVKLRVVTPTLVIREAFKAEYIDDGQDWMTMIDDRNLSSHVYDETTVSEIVARILDQHVDRLLALARRLEEEPDE